MFDHVLPVSFIILLVLSKISGSGVLSNKE